MTDTRFHRPLAAHRPLATHRFRARLRSRALTGAAAAAAITLVVPLGASAQSEIPDLGGIPGSTGAPASTSDSLGSLAPATPLEPGPEVVVEPVLDGLTIPWDVVRDPGGVVVTGERDSGAVHAVHPDGTTSAVEADFSALFTESESGLTGMALASDFDTSREVYTCHSSADEQDNRVTSWTAAEDWSSLDSPEVLVDDIPLNDGGQHSGCRILAHPDGSLYIGTGDAFTGPAPQDLDSLGGKILHVTRDGEPADDTIGDSPVLTYGHRNVQGLDLQPDTGRVFSAEHGPSIDDEVNLVIPAGNYGWDPDAGGRYNQNVPMTDTAAFPDAVEASWSSGAPTLAPAGIAFLDDPSWGEWNGALAVAMLKTQQIVLMMPSEDGRSVTRTATVIPGEHGRLRSLTAEPGGTLLATTSNGGGDDEVLRISPAGAAPRE